jgi:hypothetical protein
MGFEKFCEKWLVVYSNRQYYGFDVIGNHGFDYG